jgi:hypothetical protein
MRAFKQDRKEAADFIGRRFNLEPQVAEEVYKIVLQTLSEDGTVNQEVLQDFLELVKKESGVKKPIALPEIVDYRLLKEVAKEIDTKG